MATQEDGFELETGTALTTLKVSEQGVVPPHPRLSPIDHYPRP